VSQSRVNKRVTNGGPFFLGEEFSRYTEFPTYYGTSDGYSDSYVILHVVHHNQYRFFAFPDISFYVGTEPDISSAEHIFSHYQGDFRYCYLLIYWTFQSCLSGFQCSALDSASDHRVTKDYAKHCVFR
jgi:hypothetical protein